jgi:hypothetical protein
VGFSLLAQTRPRFIAIGAGGEQIEMPAILRQRFHYVAGMI